ncbi:MAG: S-layer homology domain-containing protein [Clostridiales bacterium]|nr:S-layer homology domain-containing protein [Clostridiales bacterium]
MKKLIALLLIISLLLCAGFALAAGGGAGDPLVSLSYIRDIFMPSVLVQAENRLDMELKKISNEYRARLETLFDTGSEKFDFSGGFGELTFSKGGFLEMDQFTSFVLTSGSANIVINSGEVIDTTLGRPVDSGTILSPKHRYFAAEGTSALVRMYSESRGLVDGYYLHEEVGEIPPNLQFIDVPSNHWANEYITFLAENGIVNGVGDSVFAPGSTVTRAAFVTILGRLAGVDISQYTGIEFSDVEPDSWYGPYISWASQNGIVTGYGNGKFGPGNNITREQMAVLIMRYADYADVTLPSINEGEEFADQAQIEAYAVEAVSLAQRAGIITGKPGGVFDPKGTALRAEISTVTYRLIKNAGLPL